MKKLDSTLPNIVLSLGLICLVAGTALALTHKYTEAPIAAARAAELQNAIRLVVPEFDNNPAEEMYRIAVSGDDSLTVYPARM
jgi:electron transport complex protein RnfG